MVKERDYSKIGSEHVKADKSGNIESFWRFEPDLDLIRRIVDSRIEHLSEFSGLEGKDLDKALETANQNFRSEWEQRGESTPREFYEKCESYIFELASSDSSGSLWRLEYLARIIGRHVEEFSRNNNEQPVRFLDFGAGLGEVGIYFASKCKVTSLDVKGLTQDFARFHAEKLGAEIEFVNDMDGLRDFDVISMQDVLEHVEKPMELLRDLVSALRPGGMLVTSGLWFSPNVPSHLSENTKYRPHWIHDLKDMGMDMKEVFQGKNWQIGTFVRSRVLSEHEIDTVVKQRHALIQAEEAASRGDLDRAGALIRPFVETTNPSAEVCNAMGVIAHSKGNASAAVEYFEKAASRDEPWNEALMNLGDIHAQLEEWDLALHYYKRCLVFGDESIKEETRPKIEEIFAKRAGQGCTRALLVLDRLSVTRLKELNSKLKNLSLSVNVSLLLLDGRLVGLDAFEKVMNKLDSRFYEYLLMGNPSKRADRLLSKDLVEWCGGIARLTPDATSQDLVADNLKLVSGLVGVDGSRKEIGPKRVSSVEPHDMPKRAGQRPRIGFISLWFPRGQAYVTRHMRQALAKNYETFVLARNGGGPEKRLLCTTGEWAVENLETWPTYAVPREKVYNWVRSNDLDVVVFNEEYDLGLVWAAKDAGAAAVGYYVWELFDPRRAVGVGQAFDAVICPTRASFKRFKEMGMENAVHLPWAVLEDTFKASRKDVENRAERVRFFHPAGFGGLHERRGTAMVIEAFKRAGLNDSELLVHSQVGTGQEKEGNVEIVRGTIDRAELAAMYKSSHAAVLPSKWEGLGLTFLESLAAGLPIVTVDAPPMNEFVVNGENGILCKVGEWNDYHGIFVKAAIADVDDLARAMKDLASNTGKRLEMSRTALEHVETRWSRDRFESRISQIVEAAMAGVSGKGTEPEVAARTADHSPPVLSLSVKDDSRLCLTAKDYSGMHLEKARDGSLLITDGKTKERFTVHLVSARRANHPWGMGNEVFRALEKMGIRVLDTDFRTMTRELPDRLGMEAHVLLVIKGNGIPPELIKAQRARTILWYQDDVFTAPHAAPQIKYNGWAFDKVYTFDDRALDRFRELGVRDVGYLPLAMSPAVHRKMFIEKEHDVCFVGNVYDNRKRLLEKLSKRFDVVVKRAFMDDMVRLFNQSRIVLNLGLGPTGIQQRVFEALGCGSLLLTNEIPEESRLFEHRVHLVYFKDDTIEHEIEYYLAHEEERERIALAGYRKAHAEHTFEKRIETMVRYLGLSFTQSTEVGESLFEVASPSRQEQRRVAGEHRPFLVMGMKRSGHHGVINWICKQLDRPVTHVNDCVVSECGELVPRKQQMYPITFHNGADENTKTMVYSIEDPDLTVGPWKDRDNLLKEFLETGTLVLVVRDPYNLFASDIKGTRLKIKDTADLLRKYPLDWKKGLWKQHAREALGKGVLDPGKLVVVLYNKWFTDESYREGICNKLGIPFTDAGIEQLSPHGGGSSFEGMNVKDARKMDVLNRWKNFGHLDFFREIFDPEIEVLAKELFGMENPMKQEISLRVAGNGPAYLMQ